MVRSLSIARRPAAIRGVLLALTVLAALPLGASVADARAGGGFSFGSRGARTFSMPAPTATAPRSAQPIWRSETPRPGATAPGAGSAAQPRRFGFGSGLMAGLLGAGLFGMLTGGGFGDIGGGGLLLQLLLIGGVVFLVSRVLRARQAGPAFAGIGSGSVERAPPGAVAGLGPSGSASTAPPIGPRDLAAFEGALVDIQTAFGREDLNALSRLTTSEMLRSFGGQIEENRRRGQRNDLSDPRLLQGDLAEAWREGGGDYATVAMRFAVRDTMVERASGRVLSGDAACPSEATELWTFRRERGGPWLLSAIQQAS